MPRFAPLIIITRPVGSIIINLATWLEARSFANKLQRVVVGQAGLNPDLFVPNEALPTCATARCVTFWNL